MRMASVKKFKNGEIDVLIATDIASRGLNLDDVNFVVNYDLPKHEASNEYVSDF